MGAAVRPGARGRPARPHRTRHRCDGGTRLTRPPLANLFAAHSPDPAWLDDLAGALERSGEFAEVWRPDPTWVAAAAPLPRSPPDGAEARRLGLAFAEGRDVIGPPSEAARLADADPDRLAALPGDFGFIRFRPRGRATVVRSCGGLVPFYLCGGGADGRWAVATRLGYLVRFLPDEPRLDPLVNAIWTSGYGVFADGRTFLEGVAILDRGCHARLEAGRPAALGRYWDPRPARLTPPSPARAHAHAHRLRDLLLRRLERDLDPEDGNLLTLSGGVDSSALGALAAGAVGRPVWTWSMLPDQADWFADEMSYIRPLAHRYGFTRSWIVRLRETTRVELLRAAPSVAFHVAHPALCALPEIVRQAEVRVLFGGEFADEVCGSALTLPDWTAHTSPAALAARLRALPFGPRTLVRWVMHRARVLARRPRMPFPPRLFAFIRPELQAEYREWLARRRRAAVDDRRPLSYLSLRTELHGFVAMNWEVASALGVRRSFPFFNREMLELACDCHPHELVGPGPKRLLRAALDGHVPPRNLYRSHKGLWSAHLRGARLAWDAALPEAVGAVVRADWLPRPPAVLDLWDACGLAQLGLFVESVAQWRARGARALTPAQAATQEAR
ncbi:MAG: asparagine synthase-related protein [Gemmatimonadales bacterium]